MISVNRFKVEKFNFPCGEMQVKISQTDSLEFDMLLNNYVNVLFVYEKNEDIVELLLVCDAILRYNSNIKLGTLTIPYVPFSRQDRINSRGEALSLKVFCDIINSLNFKQIYINDPHSDVTTALLNNCIAIAQHSNFKDVFPKDSSDFYFICPDAGAMKKIYKASSAFPNSGVIECSKQRNTSTGEITGVKVNADDLLGKDCYILDDICDGGRTFIEIAKVLRTKNCGKIILCVTHGFFTKGVDVLFDVIDEIYTRNGKVEQRGYK